MVPMSQRTSIYGRLGATYARAGALYFGSRQPTGDGHPEDKKLNPKVGLGVEFKLTEALALRGEAERYRLSNAIGGKNDANLYSVSLVYKMGRPAPKAPVVYTPPPPPPEPVAVVAPPPPPPPPAPAPKPVPVSEIVSFAAEALFDFDKSVVKTEGKAALDDLLVKLQGMNTEVMITVGHTDSVGTSAYNQKLSLRRAEAVKAYLISKGVEASRIYTEGKGETQPAADNKTAEGRSKNRRVTVEVVGTRTVMK